MSDFRDEISEPTDKHIEDLKYYTSRKLVINWNDEDQAAIVGLQVAAEKVYLELFAETLTIIENIYDSVRSNGEDNWGLLTNKQLEAHLLRLSELRIQTSLGVNAVRLDALFAKYSLDDDYHLAYLNGSGTNNLREAKAHTETVEKRYGYFFRYFIHTMCEGLSRDIDNLIKNLNSVLYRRSNA